MSLLIKNGRIITADADYVADIFIEGEIVKTIGKGLEMKAHKEIDASGKLIFPANALSKSVAVTSPSISWTGIRFPSPSDR